MCSKIYLFLLFTFLFFINSNAQDSLIVFSGTYPHAISQAASEKKPLMIIFSTSWCGFCKKMEQTTLKDPKVIKAINKYFVLFKEDAESEEGKPLAHGLGVSSYPTIVFLNGKSQPLLTSEGYHDTEDMLKLLKSVP